MIQILHYLTLGTLNYGNYGIFLTMGYAGFISPTVSLGIDFPVYHAESKHFLCCLELLGLPELS